MKLGHQPSPDDYLQRETAEEAVALNRALVAHEPYQYRPKLAQTLDNLGTTYRAMGDYSRALETTEEAVTLNRALAADDPNQYRPKLAQTLNSLGNLHHILGNQQLALELHQEALRIIRQVQDRAGEARTRYDLALTYRAQGNLAEAAAELEHVVELDRQLGLPTLQSDMSTLDSVLEAMTDPGI